MSQSVPVAPLGGPPASADDFRVYSMRPDVRFLSRGVQPPSSLYVSTNDVLVVGSASSVASEAVTISYRLLRPDGLITMGQFQVFPAADRLIVVKQEPLTEGFLLSVSCKAAAARTRGQTFVRVFLTDPVLGPGQPSYMLMADYVTTAMAPAHPNGRVLAPTEGPGNITSVPATGIVPGIDPLIIVPANARWRIICGTAQIFTDLNIGARIPEVRLVSGGFFVWQGTPTATVPAASTVQISYGAVAPVPLTDPFEIAVPIPPQMFLSPAGIINAVTRAIDPGDVYNFFQFQVEEWLDNV